MVDTTPLQTILARQVDEQVLAAGGTSASTGATAVHRHHQYGGWEVGDLGYGGDCDER